MDDPFIGSEALESGLVRKHELRSRFRRLFPDVYLPDDVPPTLQRRARAAWLWSHRQGVIAGLTASALHGAKWVDDSEPIELIWSNARAPERITIRRDCVLPGEVMTVDWLCATTPERTAFDLGRLIGGNRAIERLDALGNATRFRADDVAELARRHRGSPGGPRLRAALDLYDPGAQSPRETWLRLLLIRAGYPRPKTQIPIFDDAGEAIYFLDMGWQDRMIAVEYDGDEHRQVPRFRKDIVRSEYLAYRGWTHIRVVAGNRPYEILNRVRRAWASSVRSDRGIA